ncbi:Ulp1 protease family, C-terminal catalytic domain containing [Olea europaea subsp. europaea]|uniref:Ulp1 protease family, C-terminal catalytic domain containing n=1 Tax=Olea europaea subsp. europaea TaxID=158383 RepID=A0A8S0QS18_OLEEU|nr:Ulp1 protease family, C-terminal catalytic domain containing [Olea europaea subsp. europaea]
MDMCFYCIRQLASNDKNIKVIATTTDTLFQAKLKNMYHKFKQDLEVIVTDERLIDDITGARIPLTKPWAEVDLVFMPILPTNKAHWMFAVLDIKKQTLLLLNSVRKTYNGIKVLIGIDPFVKMISHLIDHIEIWRKDSDPSTDDSKELKVVLNSSIPQQNNGHNSGIYVIKYVEYMLHDDLGSMPVKFDTAGARLDLHHCYSSTVKSVQRERRCCQPVEIV